MSSLAAAAKLACRWLAKHLRHVCAALWHALDSCQTRQSSLATLHQSVTHFCHGKVLYDTCISPMKGSGCISAVLVNTLVIQLTEVSAQADVYSRCMG